MLILVSASNYPIDPFSSCMACGLGAKAMEVAFGSAGILLFGPAQEPSKGVAPRRLLPALLLGLLKKLSESRGAEEMLLLHLGRSCMSITGESLIGAVTRDCVKGGGVMFSTGTTVL